MKTCRYCKLGIKEGEEVETHGYWCKIEEKLYSHKECKTEGLKKESFDCQCIDKDCNDCKFFEREKFDKKLSDNRRIFPRTGGFKGLCKKFNNKETKAFPNYCSNHECFAHRRS